MECDFIRKGISSRWGARLVALALVLLLGTTAAVAQGTQAKIVGEVSDPTGAMVVGAQVELTDQGTNEKWTAKSGADGHFVFLALKSGLFKVTVKMQGFTTVVIPNVKVDLGQTATVTAKLTVGAATSEVVVEAGAEVLQTQTSAIEGVVSGKAVRSLPLNNRDALDFVLNMPGGQASGGQARQSTFNALPKSAISITMDGINIQDNMSKGDSGGGMFTMIRPKQELVEEVSVTTSAASADTGPDGAVQIKFTTRRGTNELHGSAFEQYRDQGLNANTFFLNRQTDPKKNGCYGVLGAPPCRPKNHLQQYGFSIGGPIIKDRMWAFFNFEDFRFPQSVSRTANILTSGATGAQSGFFTYTATCTTSSPCPAGVSNGQTMVGNLFAIADAQAAGKLCTNCRGTVGGPLALQGVDAYIQSQLDEINATLPGGSLTAGTNPNVNQLLWTNAAPQRRFFPALRLDADVTSRLRWSFVGNWNNFNSLPDSLNGYDRALPNQPDKPVGGQYSRRWLASTALNYTINNNLTYEFRIGRQSAQTRWRPELTPETFTPTGYTFIFPSGGSTGTFASTLVNPQALAGGANSPSAWLMSTRNTPVLTINNQFGWLHGKHTVSFGSNIEIITYWAKNLSYDGVMDVDLTVNTSDPSSKMFSRTTLPGVGTTDLLYAQQLYSLLAGRIGGFYTRNNIDEITKVYAAGSPRTDRNRQNTLAYYLTDSYRFTKNLTVNAGLRWEYQGAMYNRNGIYTGLTWQDLWGKSGINHPFQPGSQDPVYDPTYQPQLRVRPQGNYDPGYKNFAPSLGFAYSPDINNWAYNKLFGGPGKTVFRGAYSLAYTRESTSFYSGWAGNNPGLYQVVSLNQGNTGFAYGQYILNGSGTPPVPAAAVKKPATFGQSAMSDYSFSGSSFYAIDPNLKIPYVQSWNFGFQREINPGTVLEVRYVGNFGTRLWRGFSNVNEVNIFENGFLSEFKQAKKNLDLNRQFYGVGTPAGESYKNNSLAGQAALPIITTSGIGFTSSSRISNLDQGQAGSFANTLASSSTYMCPLVGSNLTYCKNAGYLTPGAYAANLFQANPDAAGDNLYALTNNSWSKYNALQVELRRRMSKGLLLNVAYTFGHGTTNFAGEGTGTTSFYTLRDLNLNNAPSPWDLRHVVRAYWVYELPFGKGRHFAISNSVLDKVLGGWELDGILTAQSGRTFRLTSGRAVANQYESGVVLANGTTVSQLQGLMAVNEQLGSACASTNTVFLFDQTLMNPSGSPKCSANTSFINYPGLGAANNSTDPGVFGVFPYLKGPRFVKPDLTIGKKTKIGERVETMIQARFFNAFNYRNWMVGDPGTAAPTMGINSGSFGQTGYFYSDTSNSQDQGPRTIELYLKVSF